MLKGIGVEALTSPEMTGDWEFKLKRMELGQMPRPQFMDEIRKFTEEIVHKAKNFSGDSVEGRFHDLEAKCPRCSAGPFKESFKAYECPACKLLIWKNMAGRELEREDVQILLEKGLVGPLEGFRSKMGRPFSAIVKLGEDFKPTFDFGNDNEAQEVDFSLLVPIGACPICKDGTVYDSEKAFVCNHATGASKTCTFRMGKNILQREIPIEQVKKLMETGKTDLLPRFISKKGKPFSAFLKLEKGKVGFEFEPRKPAAPKKKATKAPVQAEAA